MEVFLARQPILNVNEEICAYELLYRKDKTNYFPTVDSDRATVDVMNSFIQIGIEELSEGRPCFINFTDKLLQNEIPAYFQPEMVVIEILETVKFSDDFIDICRKLKMQGFKLALDDFEMNEEELNFNLIMNLVDIVKVDIQNTPRDKQIKMLKLLKQYNVDLLAEKVETREEYQKCLKDGYKYFQGYFFSKPSILSTYDLEIQNSTYYELIMELSQPNPNIDKIATNIERDVSISYKILKMINSPAYRRLNEIKSIKQAIVLVGLVELKKWLFLMYIREEKNKKNHIQLEITKMSMTRARVCELIAIEIGKRSKSSSYFLTGLFSLIDTLLKQPTEKIINQLPLDKEIKETLIGNTSPYGDVLELVILLEKGERAEVEKMSRRIGIGVQKVFEIYLNTIKWTKEILAE